MIRYLVISMTITVGLVCSLSPAIAEEKSAVGDAFSSIDSKLAEEEAALMKELDEPKKAAPKIIVVEHNSTPKEEKTLTFTNEVTAEVPAIAELRTAVQEQKQDIGRIQTAKYALEKKLTTSERRILELMAQLRDTREELLLAETEVDRLSRLIEERNIQSVSRLRSPAKVSAAVLQKHQQPYIGEPTNRQNVAVRKQQANRSLSIATIAVEKANLRTGPGLNNSVLLTVGKDSRLVVEKRQGEWYRVVAPSGERAWISAKVVNFGPHNLPHTTRVSRVKGYSSIVHSP